MSTHTSFCMLCGSPCKTHAFIIEGNNSDLDSISNDIKRLDMAIDTLRLLKSQRCRQLNTFRSSTRTLPNEILLSIFQLFCSSFRSQDFPQFILGGVCSRWRNLINNEPRFWKNIDLQVGNRLVSNAVSLLEVFKEHNGAVFEFIRLKFEGYYDDNYLFEEQLSPSMRGLTTSRISLHEPPVDLLGIINNNLNTHDVSLAGLSYLTNGLKSIRGFLLPWSALTTLRVSCVEIDTCCDLLLGCPNLIRFSSYEPLGPSMKCTRPNTHHARKTLFPHLQHLTWHHYLAEWDDNLLSSYRFPALQHFHWHGRGYFRSPEPLYNFISFLPQSCHTFHLSTVGDEFERLEMEFLLRIAAHPFERLICSHFDPSFLSVALERLQDPAFLPSLTFFKWEHRSTQGGFDKLTDSIKDVIRGRKEAGVGRFRMEIDGILLPRGFNKERSYRVMGGGFDFEIVEDRYWIVSF